MNTAVAVADAYPVFVQLNCTVTDPVVVVVTDTSRIVPELSLNDTDAAIPEERDAEHDAEDGTTVNPSVITPAPVREPPKNPETTTGG